MTMGAVSNRGRRRAQQLVCASQLGKWGQAIIMQSGDNDDEVMSIVRRWGGIPMTHYMATIEVYHPEPGPWDDPHPDEWNAYSINPYLPILDNEYANNGIVTRFVGCPSTNVGFIQEWNREVNWPYNCNPGSSLCFIEIAYSFWGRADGLDVENRSPSALNLLTLNEMSDDRLIMSDILFLTGDTHMAGYRYNHSIDGWSWNGYIPGMTHSDQSPNPKATGRNQLFGDGRVTFKKIALDENLPTLADPYWLVNDGMWNGQDSGWVGEASQYVDVSYF
jgi:hypothetical protein